MPQSGRRPQHHSRRSRAAGKAGHVRYAAESGIKFRALAAPRRTWFKLRNRIIESCAMNSATSNGSPSSRCGRTRSAPFASIPNLAAC